MRYAKASVWMRKILAMSVPIDLSVWDVAGEHPVREVLRDEGVSGLRHDAVV